MTNSGNTFTEVDQRHMALALTLAKRGLCTTMPNPRVGCVLARQDEVIAMGWHAMAGGPHAEVVALHQAGERAAGTCAYVTLEPCSHYGRTPPCAQALLRAGVARVVVAIVDPNPKVSGRGLEMLRQSDIEVCHGLMPNEAVNLNLGFLARMRRGTPWLRLRISADAGEAAALRRGNTSMAASAAVRQDVQTLWARSCALLTGAGTVLRDDPLFTVSDPASRRQPVRIVLDSRLRVPPTARMLQTGTTWILTASDDETRTRALRNAGATVVRLPGEHNRLNLRAVLGELGQRELNEITVEAESSLCRAFLQAQLVDEIVCYGKQPERQDPQRGILAIPPIDELAGVNHFQLVALAEVGTELRAKLRPTRVEV